MLLKCLKNGEVDEFMYKVSLYRCEREVLNVSRDIEEINDQQAARDLATTNESLPNLQRAATRLKSCIQENRAYEDKLRRASFIPPTGYLDRTEFEKLAIRFSEIDNSLVQCFYRQMTTLTAAGNEENLQQTKATNVQARATYEQTTSMSALTWLALVYVPLTFVSGIFGMNVKEIDPDKKLSWRRFAWIAAAFLGGTMAIAFFYQNVQKRRARNKFRTEKRHERSQCVPRWHLRRSKSGADAGSKLQSQV